MLTPTHLKNPPIETDLIPIIKETKLKYKKSINKQITIENCGIMCTGGIATVSGLEGQGG